VLHRIDPLEFTLVVDAIVLRPVDGEATDFQAGQRGIMELARHSDPVASSIDRVVFDRERQVAGQLGSVADHASHMDASPLGASHIVVFDDGRSG